VASETQTRDSIFCRAIEIGSAEERAAFIARACGEDPELRRGVEKLVAAHFRAGSFLEAHDPGVAATVDSPLVAERPGTTIGPYKLLQQIGEGGMGTVFMAEQTRPVQRKVALKVIKPGMDSRQVIARFEAERQALALMDHPNIARVLDAGTTDSGRPYFLMELVKGAPITCYCDDNRLTPKERLELFIPVCQAVQHAHQKGIIHRDLKPSNVLVARYDGLPVPKVIDFGIAKATGQKLTERTLFTEFGAVVGTLEYMSPEQAELNQLDIDTRSDVYSLGVLLYELLTGTTPLQRQRLSAGALLEALRIIREEEPPKPSTRLSTADGLETIAANRGLEPKTLSGLVRGELDWIVMKALEKNRARRYDTANGLATDLQRYLADEPVLACPPSAGYRLGKLVRRNRAAVTVIGLVAALLLIGTAVSTALALWATRAEGLATERLTLETAARTQAVEAERDGKRQLARALLAQASAGRWSRQVGRRFAGLKALTEAAALAREVEMDESFFQDLRNETIACLALADLDRVHQWEGWPAGYNDSVAFDADLRRYARFDGFVGKNNVEVLQVEDDRLLARLPPATTGACWACFSPDGSLLAVGYGAGSDGEQPQIQVWDWQRKEVVFHPPFPATSAPCFSPDGRRLAVGATDGTVAVYRVDGWAEVVRFKPSVRALYLAWHPDGTRVAVSGLCEGSVEVWDTATKTLQFRVSAPGVYSLGWHPRGELLAVGCSDSAVHLYDGATGGDHLVLRGHLSGVVGVNFAADGDLLVSGSWDGSSHVWCPWTGRDLLRFAGEASHVSRDGRRLASRAGHTLTVWDVNPGREYLPLPPRPGSRGEIGGVTCSPDGRWLIANGGTSRIWDLTLRKEVGSVPGTPPAVGFHSNSEFFANGPDGLSRWSFAVKDGVVHVRPITRWMSPPFPVDRLALDREGRLAVVSREQRAAIINLTGSQGSPLELDHSRVDAVSASPDGRWAATGTAYGNGVRIWDARSGKLEKELLRGEVNPQPCFSPDGRWLLIVTGSGFRIWESGTWRPVRQFAPDHGGDNPKPYAFTQDGSILAAAVSLTTVCLFDTRTWQPVARLQGADDDWINHVSFTPDGASLLVKSAGSTGVLRVWDLRRIREQLAAVRLNWDLPAYPPAPAAADVEPVRGVEVTSGMEGRSFVGHTAQVWWVGFSPDGRTAFSTSFDKTLRAWDVSTGKELRCFRGHTDEVYGAALSGDGRRLLSGGKDGTVRLWDVASGNELRRREAAGHVTSVAFAREGRRALITYYEGLTLLWDVGDWKELRQLKLPVGLWSVAFAPDDSQALIAGGTDGPINRPILRLWGLKDGKELDHFELSESLGLWSAVFAPDGKRILTAGGDGVLRLLDVTTGKEIRQFRGHQSAVTSTAFSPDCRRALSTGDDGTARLWDVQSGQQLDIFRAPAGAGLRGVAFSPDGRSAVCGSGNGEVWLVRLPPEEETPPKDK
jgi:WD40 repeat protein/serine/threonine protein kinase